jgi:hypothetical protein
MSAFARSQVFAPLLGHIAMRMERFGSWTFLLELIPSKRGGSAISSRGLKM